MTNKISDDFDPKLDELLRLPRFNPSEGFSDRVMSQVAVFQQRAPVKIAASLPATRRLAPVAARAEWAVPPVIARWIPASRPARFAAGALAVVTSFATTAAAVIVAGNLGLVSFVGSLAFDRMVGGMVLWGSGFVDAALGQGALDLVTGGPAQSALVFGGLAAGGIAAFAGLRKAASLTPRTI